MEDAERSQIGDDDDDEEVYVRASDAKSLIGVLAYLELGLGDAGHDGAYDLWSALRNRVTRDLVTYQKPESQSSAHLVAAVQAMIERLRWAIGERPPKQGSELSDQE